MPAVMFVSYLLYGFLRPFISRAWRREIEDEDDGPEGIEPERLEKDVPQNS
jgi:CDP-diacylglycerol--serine O-phosphatidyltransferase